MNKEEVLKYAKIFSNAKGNTFKIHFLSTEKETIIDEVEIWKVVLNLIDKQQKEIKHRSKKWKE